VEDVDTAQEEPSFISADKLNEDIYGYGWRLMALAHYPESGQFSCPKAINMRGEKTGTGGPGRPRFVDYAIPWRGWHEQVLEAASAAGKVK